MTTKPSINQQAEVIRVHVETINYWHAKITSGAVAHVVGTKHMAKAARELATYIENN